LPHPSEDAIVREVTRDHGPRLRQELESAAPEIIVTLGNAALRVLRTLVDTVTGEEVPAHVSDKIEHYGRPIDVRLATGRRVIWLPLAHPAAPQKYQILHDQWMKAQPTTQCSDATINGSLH
jgi:uracil-DNA glycosylase